MFNFFKRKGGKAESPESPRKHPTASSSVEPRATNQCDITNEKTGTIRKDVVNLLIPETDYNTQKTGVGALLEIMAGKRKRGKRKREIKDNTQAKRIVVPPTPAKNTQDTSDDPAEFVRALVLQKYAKAEPKQHVSLVYVSNEQELEDKRHAEALLREIAKSIDCDIDLDEDEMGAADSKQIIERKDKKEPVYETLDTKSIRDYKNGLKGELNKLLDANTNKENKEVESPESGNRKSNLKPPKSDNEGCSDDDRSDNGKKRVTFRKRIVFDDGEEQTDEEADSSFESLTSEEADYLEDLPDNDELLGGYVVSKNDHTTVINLNEPVIKVECVDDLRRITSDNSDSGFIESGDETSDVKSIVEECEESGESESEEEVIEEIIEEIVEEIEESDTEVADDEEDDVDEVKDLVNQESRYQTQVATLTELADTRCNEAENARELIVACRKEIEEKEQQIEQLKCDLAAAHKESELVRQRSRSLEEELVAARKCSADLADDLQRRIEEAIRQLRSELEDARSRRAELEARVQALERDKERLEQEKLQQELRAKETLETAEENTVKWRAAHEAARSQAAARAERMLADCEWKMRELEKRARDAEKEKRELTETVEQLKASPPTPSHVAELQQLRGLASEQQRSVQCLTLQIQKIETREEALKLEVHRLKDLLDKQARIQKDKEEQHLLAIERLSQQHLENVAALKAEHSEAVANASSARAALERAHAERTRTTLAQLRVDAEKDARNADRKLRELSTRFENLKEVLASKESQFEHAIAEAHSKADWELLQLRHTLDKADITYANTIEAMNQRFEREREQLTSEWSAKVREVEEQAATAATEAKKLLEATRMKLIAEKNDVINKLKEKHQQEVDDQWEFFMSDKENCLQRMKVECRQEGEEERLKREKDLLEEIAELKSQIHCKSTDYEQLTSKAAACGRELAVTEQELREALAREKELREKRSEDATKIKQLGRANQEQVEHLTRKCACLRKLFDDMRARLAARERAAEQEARSREKELHQLRAEVARLTKILVEQSSPRPGVRTRADGCEQTPHDESFFCKRAPLACDTQPNPPRRKGGTLRTPEPIRKRLTLPDLQPLPPEARLGATEFQDGRRRAKSVDLPAVQVPIRIKQLEMKNNA